MGQTFLSIKNKVKANPLGKRLRDLYQRRGFTRKNAEKAFSLYYGESKLDREIMVNDMLREAKKYNFGFDEYYMYHFETMPFEKRRTYVSDRDRISYCERMNNMRNMIVFDDKGKTYEKYKQYYHRDLLEIFAGAGVEKFEIFVKKHPRFIVKPFDGACGIGIKIIDSQGKDGKDIYNELINEYRKGAVCEELIIQHPEIEKLHPQSVNTLRITTISFKDRVEVIHPILRVGRGNAVVDNGGSGGICCGIDPETGITFSAADERGNSFFTHPDTGIELIGFKVPFWEDAKLLVLELAQVLPDNHYTGWDLALTNDGWVLQEANDRGTFILFQITTGKGFKPEIEKIVEELGV